MPDKTLEAFYDHGEVGEPMPADGGDCDALFKQVRAAGRRHRRRSRRSCRPTGRESFDDAWKDLMQRIEQQERSGGVMATAIA